MRTNKSRYIARPDNHLKNCPLKPFRLDIFYIRYLAYLDYACFYKNLNSKWSRRIYCIFSFSLSPILFFSSKLRKARWLRSIYSIKNVFSFIPLIHPYTPSLLDAIGRESKDQRS